MKNKVVYFIKLTLLYDIFLIYFQKWEYNYVPVTKSKEHALLKVLQNPVDWV